MNYTAMVIMGLALFVGLIFLGREITRWYFYSCLLYPKN